MELGILSHAPALSVVPEPGTTSKDGKERLKTQAKEFESVYLQSMLSQMFAGVPTEGAFHGGQAEETFRGMLIEQYAKNIARAGGVGIADAVYNQLLKIQEGRA